MSKNLVIVESPAKAKTIEKYLGKDFQVESSFGHIADLPSKEIGIDVEGDFKPRYSVSSDKRSIVKKLKDLARKADMIWLASDEDREGEAIAWHLFEQLKLKEANTKRIVFHEITQKAILKAVENPRNIDYNLVNAQQARRVLDRLVGYELSPVLWRKIKGGLSAGRVQSVAVRLIVEKERDILNFKSQATYKIVAEFLTSENKKFRAALAKNYDKRAEAESFLNSCIGADFKVEDLQKKPAKKYPAPPFTTSTLQQEASRKHFFPVAKTMLIAQKLYEAGLITYMRTDSVHLSDDAKSDAQSEIIATFGDVYSKPRNFNNKSKGAQEAHEAIRPTNMGKQSISLDHDQNRLYNLIWKRTIASQMSEAQLERTNVRITNSNNNEVFNANGEMIKFDGFLKVYLEGTDIEDEVQTGMLPKLSLHENLNNNYITATERYSKAPYRFTEASLVKRLEELGIGRPSTYAPTISTIQRREYVEKGIIEGLDRNYVQLKLINGIITNKTLTEKVGADKGKLIPTDIGNIVNDFLVENFSNILDFGFTAKVESEFDDIAEGKVDWIAMIKEFYGTFHTMVEDVALNAERAKGERLLGVDPKTNKNVYARLGRFGAMVQIGEVTDDEKPKFASLQGEQTIASITFEEAMDLFKLPKKIGGYEGNDVIVASGRFGPYIKFDKMFVSLSKDENPMSIDINRAIELIQEKRQADAPIGEYENMPVQKGVGRFGPFIKWNSTFINVNRKYDFDNLTQEDIAELIEDKKTKDIEKVIHNWAEEGIRVEKARWGRSNVIKGKIKIELPKSVDAKKLTLDKVKEIIEKKAPKKKTSKLKSVKK
jgi:DNA topoisomerase-1